MSTRVQEIEHEIAAELRQMYYSLPEDDSYLMAERAYQMAEEHIMGRMAEVLSVVPDASLRGALEFWKVVGHVD